MDMHFGIPFLFCGERTKTTACLNIDNIALGVSSIEIVVKLLYLGSFSAPLRSNKDNCEWLFH
jgi:hypothetical protein